MQQTIKVIVKSPEAILFNDAVHALSTFNTNGPLDILPLHENFISIIEKEVILHTLSGEKSFPVENGILKVTSEEVVILLGIQSLGQPSKNNPA